MKRRDLDWGYLLSFFSAATMAALVPAACSETKDPYAQPGPAEAAGNASVGGADNDDAGAAGRGDAGGERAELGGAAAEDGSKAGAGNAGSAGLEPSCEEPTSACGETCVDLSLSLEHCGACDHACTGSDACVEGECKPRAWDIPAINAGFDLFNPIVQLAEDGRAFVVARSSNAKGTLRVSLLSDDALLPGFAQELTTLEHTENIAEVRFAMNRTGKGVVAFITSASPRKLYASYFDGEELAAPVLLDDSGLGVGASPYIDSGFSLTIEDDGAANVVYRRYQVGTEGAEDLYGVTASGFGEAWGTPTPLEEGMDSVTEHHVATSGHGRLLASWTQGGKIFASTLDHGAWSAPTRLSDADRFGSEPRAALSPDGKAVAVFLQSKYQENGAYRASFDGEAWSSPELLAGSDHQEDHAAVALRADGSGLFSYEVRGGAGENDRVFVVSFESASELSEAKELTSTPIVGQAPRAFVGPARSGGVLWANNDDYHRTKVALTDGTDFSEWAIPSGSYHSVIPSIDYNDAGDGIVVWHDSSANLGYRRYHVLAQPAF